MSADNAFTSLIATAPNFPKPGVMYFDFTPLLREPAALNKAVTEIESHYSAQPITKIAAVEAKGFTIGAALAFKTQRPLILIRKPELMPGEVDRETFDKEYGTGEYQLKKSDVKPGDCVLIIYDIMAGPGAARAAINLIERAGGTVVGAAFVIELAYLKGREELPGYDLFSLVKIIDDPRHNMPTDSETIGTRGNGSRP